MSTAGRVDKLSDPQVWVDRAGVRHSGLEAWVAAFTDKVRQISERRCAE